jgi:hypothetical protein
MRQEDLLEAVADVMRLYRQQQMRLEDVVEMLCSVDVGLDEAERIIRHGLDDGMFIPTSEGLRLAA